MSSSSAALDGAERGGLPVDHGTRPTPLDRGDHHYQENQDSLLCFDRMWSTGFMSMQVRGVRAVRDE